MKNKLLLTRLRNRYLLAADCLIVSLTPFLAMWLRTEVAAYKLPKQLFAADAKRGERMTVVPKRRPQSQKCRRHHRNADSGSQRRSDEVAPGESEQPAHHEQIDGGRHQAAQHQEPRCLGDGKWTERRCKGAETQDDVEKSHRRSELRPVERHVHAARVGLSGPDASVDRQHLHHRDGIVPARAQQHGHQWLRQQGDAGSRGQCEQKHERKHLYERA